RRAACLRAVHGASATTRSECTARERPRRNVSGNGCGSCARFPRFSECGYGHWRNAGDRHTVALNELRWLGHFVCVHGDRLGDECPAAPVCQLSREPNRQSRFPGSAKVGKFRKLGFRVPRLLRSSEQKKLV